ncbi:MAG TPA: RNA polymerase sigma factor [Candidatus Limnocylindrales bacterium]
MTTRSDAAPTALVGAADTRRDTADFEAAVRPHYAPLVRRLVVVLGNEHDAEDIAQDAYLRAFRSWDRFDGADVRAWLYTIALRLAFNQLRRRRRWLGFISRAEPVPWSDRSDPDLWIALRRLDPRSRAALLLNVLDGYTQREIATMFGVPEGTVSSWLSRARATLRRVLAEHPDA